MARLLCRLQTRLTVNVGYVGTVRLKSAGEFTPVDL